jgi:hypothetical protein
MLALALLLTVAAYPSALASGVGIVLIVPLAFLFFVVELAKPVVSNLGAVAESVWRSTHCVRRVVIPRGRPPAASKPSNTNNSDNNDESGGSTLTTTQETVLTAAV